MSKDNEKENEHEWNSNEPHYWLPMTKDEINWVMGRIRVGDTAWLCRAISAHMRHICEEISRREGKSLVLQEILNSEGRHEEKLVAWDNLHAPDNPWLDKEHVPNAPDSSCSNEA